MKNTENDALRIGEEFFAHQQEQLKIQKSAFKKLAQLVDKYHRLEQDIIATRDQLLETGVNKNDLLTAFGTDSNLRKILRTKTYTHRAHNDTCAAQVESRDEHQSADTENTSEGF
ncbi:hypothetical protein EBF03_02860 [Arcanobacterium haemolyticum]|uniref:Uncharacterized protein n=1 Tax=Arcanobacterium haemolyticum (strain ATCC 9345 / DSM 20595 / CCM 5947 / CCUG 17215 / LMG 16163 / NBRC 15585 / NCTC 8452 / 11018) TaxID=644284 RepID=D7BN33_ARCHD|nr:hypothetical protein [Arcanobacterium haemolyticum]ADH92332.1 hypothetical protein Arch_0594 [Arcanobacterium haemolyticum DSM 20595]QCX46465.1 hypothetical protein EBF03_02860 [Arcanobacterium haemolyticum]SQH28946.1 Uncharacterised protein [Arcanobacterium haemolyticum]